jgi:PAS domain S-box-containing protein
LVFDQSKPFRIREYDKDDLISNMISRGNPKQIVFNAKEINELQSTGGIMKQKLIWILVLISTFQLVFYQQALPFTYPLKIYTTQDGLVESEVLSIMQDSKGYLWFGTWNGVSKFDGKLFNNQLVADKNGSNAVSSMLEDRQGNLWFGTFGGGVVRFDGETWRTFDMEDGLANNRVTTVIEDSQGNIWLGTEEAGASKFNGETWRSYTDEIALINNTVKTILEDMEGNLWFGSNYGFTRFDGKTAKCFYSDKAETENQINSIIEDSKGNIWVGTEGGASKFDNFKWSIPSEGNPLTGIPVLSIYEDTKGRMWFGTRQKGVYCFDGISWTSMTKDNGLADNTVAAIYGDKENNIWFATMFGVCKLLPTPIETFTIQDGLPENTLYPQIEDRKGNIWFGSHQSGACRFDGESWKTFTTADGLGANRVMSILEDSRGGLWFGTWHGGLSRYDGKQWKTYTQANGLGSETIFSLYEDTQGNIWAGTSSGASKYDGRSWSNYRPMGNNLEYNVYSIIEDKDGRMWFGTFGGGVGVMDVENWRIYTTKDGLAGNVILTIFKDTDENLWFASQSNGISMFNGNSFTNYSTEDGLSSNNTVSITQQGDNLYFGTSKGINKFDGKTFKVYTSNNGLPADGLGRYSLSDSKGFLWFVTLNGTFRFKPDLDVYNPVNPPVYINRVSTFDEKIIKQGSRIKNSDKHLKFEYVGISFASPEDITYNYLLEGFRTEWIETKERHAQYTNLPSGQYTFKVKARNKEGVWSESPAEFSFEISLAFWETWWFRISCTVLMLGLIQIIFKVWYRFRATKDLKKKNDQLKIEINDRRKAEEELKERQGLLQAIFDNIGSVIVIKDAQGRYLHVNRTTEKIVGKRNEEIVGKTPHDIYPHEIAEGISADDKKVIESGKPLTVEEKLRPDDNRIYLTTKIPLFDDTGKIRGVCGLATDITERKQLEEEHTKATKLESIGVLAGGIAHDFNNILTSILGNISLAMMVAKDEKQIGIISLLSEAEGGGQRAKDLTHQLLTFSKGGVPNKKLTSLAELIKEVAGFALRGSNVKCNFSITEDLYLVEVDEGQISQVIQNLIINADQAMPEGGTIMVSAENMVVDQDDSLPIEEGKYAVVAIKDIGTGIPQEHLQRIFDPYFTTKQKGSGLGLTTCYSIIKRHGGHIEVESEDGIGTTFSFYLPASSELSMEVKDAKEEAVIPSSKVLVMDDEKTVLEVSAKMLKMLGHNVECSVDGKEAIELYKKAIEAANPFDVVILDLTIPGGMGGKETVEELRKIDPHVKAVVSSGYSNDPVMAEPQKYEFSGVVSKPFKIEELSKVLQSVLNENKG